MTAPSRGCAGLLGGALALAQPKSPHFPPPPTPARWKLSPWQGFFLLGSRKELESHPLWVENPALLQDFPVAGPSLLLQGCRLLRVCVLGFFFSGCQLS